MAALSELNMINDWGAGDKVRRKISERVVEYFRKWSVLIRENREITFTYKMSF